MAINETETQQTNGRILDDRDYWCKNASCTKMVRSRGIPSGWYLLRRNPSNEQGDLVTVAIVCSVLCLFEDLSRDMIRRMRQITKF